MRYRLYYISDVRNRNILDIGYFRESKSDSGIGYPDIKSVQAIIDQK